MKNTISDARLDAYYGKDYYGEGHDYFNPPEEEEKYCMLCGKPKSAWEAVYHKDYCEECYGAVIDGLLQIRRDTHGEESDIWDAIDALWDKAYEVRSSERSVV